MRWETARLFFTTKDTKDTKKKERTTRFYEFSNRVMRVDVRRLTKFNVPVLKEGIKRFVA